MLRKKSNLIIVFCCFFQVSSLFAGPWVMPPKSAFVGLIVQSAYFDELYSHNGDLVPAGGDIIAIKPSLFSQVGIVEDLNVLANIPYDIYLNSPNQRHTLSGVGDVSLGLQYRVLREEDHFATVSLAATGSAALAQYEANELAGPGDRAPDFLFKAIVGKYFNINERTYFYSVDAGYHYRTQGLSGSLFLLVEFGTLLSDKWFVSVLTQTYIGIGGIGLYDKEFNTTFARTGRKPFAEVAEQYINAGVSVTYQVTDRFGITLNPGVTVWARSSPRQLNLALVAGYMF